ncbi:hypothetical protein AC1031_021987 [Aphanomyces cochlioides]|nr:hypothetical protein AC1031_021987 [Aphanomyces cochlioides]
MKNLIECRGDLPDASSWTDYSGWRFTHNTGINLFVLSCAVEFKGLSNHDLTNVMRKIAAKSHSNPSRVKDSIALSYSILEPCQGHGETLHDGIEDETLRMRRRWQFKS